MERIPIWIDTDTGVDDAVALLLALKLDKLDIKGVSAVAGNSTLDNTFRNARDVLSLAEREDIKVYAGADRPLVKELRTSVIAHGDNGLGNAIIPASKAPIEEENAYDALYECAKALEGELVLVTIGPLTNVAIAIAKHPDIVDYIKEIDMMGGAADGGNVTPCAEFNVFVDPHAAENVFKSGIKINMFGLDVTLKALLNINDIEEIRSYGNKASKLFADSTPLLQKLYENHVNPGLCEHDSCPIMYLAYPEMFVGKECGVYCETQGNLTMGKTVTDLWTDYKYEDRHCKVFLDVDREAFADKIKEIYRSY